jgi:hypothetical protein
MVLVPIFETNGAYFYDFTEIFFLFAFMNVFIYRRFILLAVPLAILGTANKEAFILFMICAAPLLVHGKDDRLGFISLSVSVIAGAIVYYCLIQLFSGNPGSHVKYHMMENIIYYLTPNNLLSTEIVYRMRMFRAYSIVALAALAFLIYFARGYFTPRMKLYAVLTTGLNLPLVLLFCAPGEMRNFSFSYPVLVILIAATIDRLLAGVAAPLPCPVVGPAVEGHAVEHAPSQ